MMKFIVGTTKLTLGTAQVLNATDKLEKNLAYTAVENSVDSDDGGKSLIRSMSTYEAENAIANLVKAWVKNKWTNLKDQLAKVCSGRHGVKRLAGLQPELGPFFRCGAEDGRRILDAFFELPISTHSSIVPTAEPELGSRRRSSST